MTVSTIYNERMHIAPIGKRSGIPAPYSIVMNMIF